MHSALSRLLLPCALLLAFAPVGGAAIEARASFASPAQAWGDVGVTSAQWALLVFHGDAAATFRLDLPDAVGHNDTLVEHGLPVLAQTSDRDARQAIGPSYEGPVQASLGFARHAWSSLYVEADAIDVVLPGVAGTLQRADGGGQAAAYLPQAGQPRLATSPWGQATAPDGALASLDADGAAFHVTLSARGVRHVAWHNATIDCAGAASCPDAGEPWSSPPGQPVPMRRLSYVRLDAAGAPGALDGGGPAWAVAIGSRSLGAAVDGALRMQDARVAGACGEAACADPGGRTLRGDGLLRLSGLGADPVRPGHLAGALGGDFEHAAFDERPAPPGYARPAAAAAVGLLSLAVLAKVLAALFARSSRPPALEQPRRRAVYRLIQAAPGLSYRELQRRTGWPNGPLQNHLRRLADEGLIVGHRLRNTVRWFENHGRYASGWRAVAQLNEPRAERLHEWLRANAGAGQRRVVEQAAAWGWTRTATQRVLRGLVEAGLVAAARDGRGVSYRALAVPAPS